MPDRDQLSVFSLRSLGDFIIVYGARKVESSATSWTHEYDFHWTGDRWEAFGGTNAYIHDHRKYADEQITEYGDEMLKALPETSG